MRIIARIEGGALGEMAARLRGFADLSAFAGLLNTAGEAIHHATVAAEAKQTSLSPDTMERAQQVIPASAGNLRFTIWSHGGNVRLKYFGAKEGGGGVTAHPWGSSRFYPGAFITSGRAPNRKPAPKLNGQVYLSDGTQWFGKIVQERSGLFIPTEMTRGATASAFDRGANAALVNLESRLLALL